MPEYRAKRLTLPPQLPNSARLSREQIRLPTPLSARFHFTSSSSVSGVNSLDPLSALLTSRRNYIPPRTAPATLYDQPFSSPLVVKVRAPVPGLLCSQQTRDLLGTSSSFENDIRPASSPSATTVIGINPSASLDGCSAVSGCITPFQPSSSLRTSRTLPASPPARSRAALAAEAACFQSKPEPHWADLFKETCQDLANDASRQAAFLQKMRSHSGHQISAARLAFNVARHVGAQVLHAEGESPDTSQRYFTDFAP
jgi:hypothetical protein